MVTEPESIVEQAEDDIVSRKAGEADAHFTVSIADNSLLAPRLLPTNIGATPHNTLDAVDGCGCFLQIQSQLRGKHDELMAAPEVVIRVTIGHRYAHGQHMFG
jgi:hypothetical protein